MSAAGGRTKYACDQCRFRKLKCDGNHPCSRCLSMKLDCGFRHNRTSQARGGRRLNLLRDMPYPEPADTSPNEERRVTDILQQTSPPFSNLSVSSGNPQLGPSPLLRPRSAGSKSGYSNEISLAGAAVADALAQEDRNDGIHSTGTAPSWIHQFAAPNVRDILQQQSLNGAQPVDSHQSAIVLGLNQASPHSAGVFDGPGSSPWQPSASTVWPRQYEEKDVLQWLDVFFDRLHSTLPIVGKDLHRDFLLQRHHTDKDFAALILALCSVAIVGPVYRQERGSMPARTLLAKDMLGSAAKLRTRYDFGEQMNMDVATTVTSFLMFAALFAMGLQKAAWLKLREAVECGRLLGMHQPETYEHYSPAEKARRLRIFLILSVTERGYALQRNHEISFTGQTSEKMAHLYEYLLTEETKSASSITIHDDSITSNMLGIKQLMRLFDSVDEQVIPCWNNSCSPSLSSCDRLTVERVQNVFNSTIAALCSPKQYHALRNPSGQDNPTTRHQLDLKQRPLTETQWADCYILQQWLLMRLWTACLTHDTLVEDSELIFMRPSYATIIATRVLDECDQLGDSALEVHGNGMIERLHDIAMGLLMCLQFYAATSTVISTQISHSVFDRYTGLLCRLGGDEHSCATALRQAYQLAF